MKRQATTTQFFYQGGKLVTVNQGGLHRAIFRSTDIPLAELSTGERQETGLLEVDQSGSVLKVSGEADDEESHCYSAYGHDPSIPSAHTMTGFNGEHMEAIAAGYLLGNGYRLFNPVLMRFQAPDSISPFGKGGVNSYCYCLGDPVNRTDPDGHLSIFKPRTWFRSPTQKIEQRIGVVNDLIPDVKELTRKINNLNSKATDLERQLKSNQLKQQLQLLTERAQTKINGANKYLNKEEAYIFPDISKAKQLLKPNATYRTPGTQQDSGLFRAPRPKDDAYDDENYRDYRTTSEIMSATRRTQ